MFSLKFKQTALFLDTHRSPSRFQTKSSLDLKSRPFISSASEEIAFDWITLNLQ